MSLRHRRFAMLLPLAMLIALMLGACATAKTPTPSEAPAEAPAVEEPATEEPAVEEALVSDYEGELVISVWGGTTEEFIRAYVEPEFLKLYPKVTVIYDVGGMSARYTKLLAQKETPEVDLFVSTPESCFAAIAEGLLVPINPENIPNMQNLHEWAMPVPEYGAGYGAIAYGLGYNPDFFGDDPPTSWLDLWRPEVQGKIAVPAIGHSKMLDFIAMAAELHGGSIDNIQPGLEALAELDPAAQTFFYTNWNALFDAGDVVLATDFDYYINAMKDMGSNIEYVIPEEGAFGTVQHLSVVAGTENQEMVEAFINLFLSPEIQDLVANELKNAPALKGVQVAPGIEERLAVYGESMANILWFDAKFAQENRPAWTELMNEIVAPAWGE